MAAIVMAVQMVSAALCELLSVVWLEAAMFGLAALAYLAFVRANPGKKVQAKKQPPVPRPLGSGRVSLEMQPVLRLLYRGELEKAVELWEKVGKTESMPGVLASQFLLAAARASDVGDAAAKLEHLKGSPFKTGAFEDLITRMALQRKDMDTCRKLHQICNVLAVPKSVRTLETLAKVHSSDVDMLRGLVKEAAAPLTKCFSKVVLAACATATDVELAEEVLEKASEANSAELRSFIDIAVANLSESGSLTKHGFATCRDPVACARDIRANGRKGDLAAAVTLFEQALPSFMTAKEVPGGRAATLLINGIIDACAECGGLDRAAEYLARARVVELADTVSFNTLMKGYLVAGMEEEAQHLFAELSKTKAQVTPYSFHGLMNARVAAGDNKGAWQCLSDMLAAGVSPNSVTCAILLKGCVAAEHAVHTLRVLDTIEKHVQSQDDVLVVAVVEACMRTRQLEPLAAFLEKVASRGTVVQLSVATYGSLIKTFGQVGDVKRVWTFWREMKERQVMPTEITLGCMVEALVRNGHAKGALQLVQEVCCDESHKHLVNTVTFSTLLKGSREVEWVLEVYDEMRTRSISCNTITYNTVLNVFAENGNMRRAPKLLEDMKSADPVVEPDVVTYSTLIKGFCGCGDLDRALELFEELKRDGRHAPDEVMYNSLLDGCAKEQRVKEALALVNDMKARGVAPSNYTLSMLVKLLGRCSQLDRAFSMLEELSSMYGLRPNIPVYTCLIQACFQNRQPARAVSLLDRLMEDGLRPDQILFTALVRGCMQARQTDQAVRMVRRAYETSPPCGVDSRVLEEVVRKLGAGSTVAEALLQDVNQKQSQIMPKGRALRGPAHAGYSTSSLAERRAVLVGNQGQRALRTGGW